MDGDFAFTAGYNSDEDDVVDEDAGLGSSVAAAAAAAAASGDNVASVGSSGSLGLGHDSYPCTPPNSRMDPANTATRQETDVLPSFNNAEMLRRIEEKKLELGDSEADETSDAKHYPFTPNNSYSEGAMFDTALLNKNDSLLEQIHGRLLKEHSSSTTVTTDVSSTGSTHHTTSTTTTTTTTSSSTTFDATDRSSSSSDVGSRTVGGSNYSVEQTDIVVSHMLQSLSDESLEENTQCRVIASDILSGDDDEDDVELSDITITATTDDRRYHQQPNLDDDDGDDGDDDMSHITDHLPSVADSHKKLNYVTTTPDSLVYEARDLAQQLPATEHSPSTSNVETIDNLQPETSSVTTSATYSEPITAPQQPARRLIGSQQSNGSIAGSCDSMSRSHETMDLKEVTNKQLHVDDGEFRDMSNSPTLVENMQKFINKQKERKAEGNQDGTNVQDEDPEVAAARQEAARIIVDRAMKEGVELFLRGEDSSGGLMGSPSRPRSQNDPGANNANRPNTLVGPSKKRLTAPTDLLNNSVHSNGSGSSADDAQLGHGHHQQYARGHDPGTPDPEVDAILHAVESAGTPDDLHTPDVLKDFGGGLQLGGASPRTMTPHSDTSMPDDETKNWKTIQIGGKEYKIDLSVIEPYKKILSHGGYYGDGHNAIVVFSGCYLPDKGRRDYTYVMDNLFLYVVNTLELLVVEDYMIVYFHGATPKNKMPGIRWLRRCYDLLDRKLRKNLKRLLIVHPTFWLRTIMVMTKPFISSKFKSKLQYVHSLADLRELVPMEYVFIPDDVTVYDESKNGPTSPAKQKQET